MSWDTAMAVLATLKQRGCSIIIFEGGEPLLWSDGEHTLHDLIKYARVHFLRVCITTNGTMPFDVPADGIWVSIDGLRETHNQLRSDSFDMVWENLCASAQSNICIHYTLNRKNYSEIESLLQKLSHIPQVRGMTVQLFYPYERGEEDLRLSDAQCRDALTHVLQLKQHGYPILNSYTSLRAMMDNSWHCQHDMLINVDPDGSITSGCYAQTRGRVDCSACGFTPVAEASLALRLVPGALRAGWSIFSHPDEGYCFSQSLTISTW